MVSLAGISIRDAYITGASLLMYNDLLVQIPGLGGYIAIWKIIFLLALFGFWAWVGQWMDKDAPAVGTNRTFWNNIYLGVGLIILAFWFFLPVPFIVELLMFLVIWSTVVIIYVLHRNAKVPRTQTILTLDHIKWLLSFEERKRKKMNPRLVFISVNDNELPIPYKQDQEYTGYIAAEVLLHDMWRRRVSHVIMVPHGEQYQLRYVIDGITTVEGDRPREEAMGSIVYLKAVAGLDVEDHRRPQEGSFFTIRTGQKDTGWRISTSGSTRGEQLSLERIEETKSFTIDVVGLHPDQLEMVQKVIEQPSGITLVTGPKGNGSTTTLYGLIRYHDAFIQNIHTLENECLMEVDNISQHEMEKGPKAHSSAQQLRSVFHVDPDVLMVSFCDGKDMAQLITKAARTEKKVYVGMSADNAFQALGDWMKMVGDSKKVADTLLAVTNQRLIRVLCHECRQAYAPDVTMLKKLNLPSDKIRKFYRPPAEIEYDKHGNPILCPSCQGTGYFGRTAVFETFMISDALRKLIAEDAPVNVLRTQCRKERMLFLQEQVLRKVIDGTTSIQEVLRVTAEQKPKKTTRKK